MRVEQPSGSRGSLLWIQRAVAERWHDLETPIMARLGIDTKIDWRSPLAEDGFAEYRHSAFLQRLGLERLSVELKAFWPRRGPHWDALGLTANGQVLLVEAKAHVAEFCTPASGASEGSLIRIREALDRVAVALGVTDGTSWHRLFYQYANRLAFLWFLRGQGITPISCWSASSATAT